MDGAELAALDETLDGARVDAKELGCLNCGE
jgi:hypothetical protein